VGERDVFKVVHLEGQVRLSGVIDEHADLSFMNGLSGRVVMNLRGIRRINSFGVRTWIESIRKVQSSVSLEFVEVPPSVVDQANMVHGFLGRGRIASFYVPLTCEDCGEHQEKLVVVADAKRAHKLPEVRCPSCGKPMEVDDLEENYLRLLEG
jgi:hypothetical protein